MAAAAAARLASSSLALLAPALSEVDLELDSAALPLAVASGLPLVASGFVTSGFVT